MSTGLEVPTLNQISMLSGGGASNLNILSGSALFVRKGDYSYTELYKYSNPTEDYLSGNSGNSGSAYPYIQVKKNGVYVISIISSKSSIDFGINEKNFISIENSAFSTILNLGINNKILVGLPSNYGDVNVLISLLRIA